MVKTEKQGKWYVVWIGKQIGIFNSWKECEPFVKGIAGAKYKAFSSLEEAKQALREGFEKYYQVKKLILSGYSDEGNPFFEQKSIAVDAACSGNPGVMEYQGIDLQTGKQIFHKKFYEGTNNIGEFLALVHALSYLKQSAQEDVYIYTDSRIAISWIQQKKCKTQAVISKALQRVINRALIWLKHNSYNEKKILKWKTKQWGEIPADFGRK